MYVRDVPSEGTSSMVRSRITGRNHSYLSSHELKVHLLAEYGSATLDIREQFALLPWDETQSIAAQLGIRHPFFPGTSTPTVLTTDLLLTLERPDGMELVAISAKLKKDLTSRNLEKLLLERLYWNRRGIRWILVTEDNIHAIRAGNLMFFETALNDERVTESGINPAEFSRRFEEHWTPSLSFNKIMSMTIDSMSVDVHTGHALLGTAVWSRDSKIDIDTKKLTHRDKVHLKA
ncbi:TnsA endonuclease N-terminal domain-containing protein [Zoogloea oleivorans]|nr:TnsA endonuclease N-terminal domain-containing protein [Zoogloea oleivorans]